MKRIAILGESIAGLVLAHEISARENETEIHLFNGGMPWGGIFSSLPAEGWSLDPGMVLNEPTSFNNDPNASWLSYDVSAKNDCGRFAEKIENYWNTLGVSTVEVPSPLMYFGGELHADAVIANDLSFLRRLPEAVRSAVVAELSSRSLESSPLHPRHKQDTAFRDYSYEHVSRWAHGEWLHQHLWSPLARKLTGTSSENLSARHHRLFWLPLYYPETLIAALKQSPPNFRTRFTFPEAGSFGIFAETLVQNLRNRPWVVLHTGKASPQKLLNKNILQADFESILFNRIYFATSPSKWLPENAPATLDKTKNRTLSFSVPRRNLNRDFSTIHIPDDNSPVYRISQQRMPLPQDKAILHIEINMASSSSSQDVDIEMALHILEKLEIAHEPKTNVRLLARRDFQMSFPTFNNLRIYQNVQEELRSNYPNINRLAGAGPVGTHSFNDQVVQGHKAAEEYLLERT